MRVGRIVLATGCICLLGVSGASVRAEYVLLRTGSRLSVTGYENLGDRYRLQLKGGSVEVAAEDVVAIEPEEVFDPLPEPLTPKTPYYDLIRQAAARYGVDADLIHCVIAVESNFNPKAVSPKNARGLMQLLPKTAARMGVRDIFDPRQNIDGGTHYLRDMLAKYNHDVTLALAAYNAGPQRIEQYGHRVPPYSETRIYIQRISRAYAKFKANNASVSSVEATELEAPSATK